MPALFCGLLAAKVLALYTLFQPMHTLEDPPVMAPTPVAGTTITASDMRAANWQGVASPFTRTNA